MIRPHSSTTIPFPTGFWRHHIRVFRQDESGVSALEFALVAPFLLSLWLGMVTILDTEHATTKIGKVSATVADIIAQAPQVDSAYINAAFDAGKAMLGDTEAGSMKQIVAGIQVDKKGKQTMLWHCGRNYGSGELAPAAANIKLPSHLLQQEGFIVASYAEYKHTPLYGDQFIGEHKYEYLNYYVPRVSLQTLNSGC